MPKQAIRIKVYNSPGGHPAFGWYTAGTVRRTKAAQIDINVLALLGAYKMKQIPKAELPYFLSRTVMHEIVHAFEDWARVEFDHRKIAGILRALDKKEPRRGRKA